MIVDIGCNLSNKAFRADLDGVLDRALDARVESIVSIGVSVAASEQGRILARDKKRGPRIVATAGIHPHNAKTFSADSVVALREIALRPEIVAIGECGLDFDRDFSPRDQQLRCFEAQLELAAELRMPVYLHERAAHEAFAHVLTRFRPRLVGAVAHCFTGTERELARYLDLDLHIGLTGWLCDEQRGTHLRPLVRKIPRERLMIETDAPYILPRDLPKKPASGQNEPSVLPHILRTVARYRGESPEELAQSTTETANRFFGLARAT